MGSPTDLTGISDSIILSSLIILFSLMIRRDVALRLLGILGILVFASLLARLAGQPSFIRVIDALVFSMPVILAVIFQNDLRRALLMLGKRQQPSEASPGDETVDEVLRALADMAGRQIGALIVVVRQQPIEHLVQVGTDIDAKVTSELLNSIFLPYSPIHDGAVILHKGKITRAGCLLPLSHNPDIAKSFGTRHRAALGLSELCDALTLVVSEETGKISAVHDGKITYDCNMTDLKRLLKKAFDHQIQRL
ncbi:diadenylate cyclase CdaA [Trichlorobacter lovleyi]|uniref:diadenylate cyclase CdaA n=1 Tax=Trichlorobacter lovleyi TaxID=313985 RepID=UPI003D101AF9